MNNILVGKTITKVELTEDRGAIRFHIEGGVPIVASCDGDCCSHTWIEDVLNAGALIGTPVLEVYDLDLPPELRHKTKTNHYEEEMSYYGLQIKTSKGTATLAYRNSSNGYYGGNLTWPGEYHYGGVFDQNVADEGNWREIQDTD